MNDPLHGAGSAPPASDPWQVGPPPAQTPIGRRKKITKFLLTGVAVLLPVFLTGYVVVILCRFVDDLLGYWLGRQLASLLGMEPTNGATRAAGAVLAVVGAVALAGLVGALVGSFFGQRLVDGLQHLLLKVPLIRSIYPSVKQITDFFFGAKKPQFHSVVAVPFPSQGLYSLAFVTGSGMRSLNAARGEELVQVFVPFSPAPVTGYVIFVPRHDLIELPITVEEALQILVSGGVIIPPGEAIEAAKPPEAEAPAS
ncbi:MAG TPA: DUF502 domain-containing protein [Planctomycetota bacterium]|nr:DUF502 domain-containing protein [Planctomycetota bacterium]HRR79852.1 DUF502 domain-containing protein [Planctomycetota bacterium]HRT92928.1 DUF502 domain-containing protein [Planctomycetota bacterium]